MQTKEKSILHRFWLREKKSLAVLAALCLTQLLLRLLMNSRTASDTFVRLLVHPYHRAMGALCGLVPFSVAELCWAALVVFCLWFVVRTARLLLRPPLCDTEGTAMARPAVLLHRVLLGAVIALAVYTGYTVLWGPVYYAETFEEKAGIAAAPVTVDELERTMLYFVERLNETAPSVEHRAPGVLTGDTDAIFAASEMLYDALCEQYPFLEKKAVRPKKMMFSRVMSLINFTGFFFPFTGEANLNVDSPECLLPATIAHELAHVRGIAPEQTANFVAILACDTCGDALYAYSGYLLGYIHLSNALYGVSGDRWLPVAQQLCEEAQADLRANNMYWQQFESQLSRAANSAYSGFLQSYDQELGARSYGAVVDLLVAYYGAEAA